MDKADYKKLSKMLSHALRHAPWLYELELDAEGWTPIEAVLSAAAEANSHWVGLTESDLAQMIALSDKKRHEIADGRIRARYGHSLPGRLDLVPAVPPDTLYHGTSPAVADAILAEGLRPMGRQYVHLSVDVDMAMQVGRRKAPKPVLLVIAAGSAHADGTAFYLGNERVWLADAVAPGYVSRRTP